MTETVNNIAPQQAFIRVAYFEDSGFSARLMSVQNLAIQTYGSSCMDPFHVVTLLLISRIFVCKSVALRYTSMDDGIVIEVA